MACDLFQINYGGAELRGILVPEGMDCRRVKYPCSLRRRKVRRNCYWVRSRATGYLTLRRNTVHQTRQHYSSPRSLVTKAPTPAPAGVSEHPQDARVVDPLDEESSAPVRLSFAEIPAQTMQQRLSQSRCRIFREFSRGVQRTHDRPVRQARGRLLRFPPG